VAHAYSLDGTTWQNDTSAGNAATVNLRTSFNTLGLRSPSIYARTRLLTTARLLSPVLNFTGIGGYPATKPLPTHVLSIRAYPSAEVLQGVQTHDRGAGYNVVAQLMALWLNQTIVDYQPPWAFSDPTQNPAGISYRVRVSDLLIEKGWFANPDRPGGILSVKLKAVP
jgi:hypothetical protein